MTIEAAIQRSYAVQIYGPHGMILGSIPLETGNMLLGFTSSTVTVKKTSFIYVYDEHGAVISSYPA